MTSAVSLAYRLQGGRQRRREREIDWERKEWRKKKKRRGKDFNGNNGCLVFIKVFGFGVRRTVFAGVEMWRRKRKARDERNVEISVLG